MRTIPSNIRAKLQSIPQEKIIVACVKRVPLSEIERGDFSHLNIDIKNNQPSFPEQTLPPPVKGKISLINVDGKEVVRKDLPKIKKYSYIDSPNWGDWSHGSHIVAMPREVYVRENVAPRELEIGIENIAQEVTADGVFAIKFCINQILDRNSQSFEEDLLFNLNLLEEQVGAVDVFPADAALEDYLNAIYMNVGWEILPPGENTVERVLTGIRRPTEAVREKLLERYKLLSSLNPQAFIKGLGGFQKYFGAKFTDDLVVFENLEYGNAIYVMYENWANLSRLSRQELLSRTNERFDRIIHSEGWERRLTNIVKGVIKQARRRRQ